MSKIFVDEITGFEGTETGAPITLSGDTATLGTGATVGSGATISSSATFPTRHHFLGIKTSNQTINNGSTTLVTWDTDAYSSYDSSTTRGLDLTNNYYKVPETGYYWIYCQARINDGDTATGAGVFWIVTVNETISSGLGSAQNNKFTTVLREDNSYIDSVFDGQVMNLTQDDIVRMYCNNAMGVNRSMAGSSDGNYYNKLGGYIIR
tara:strand:+ start:342 stop:962 length:621 start_codon:yes stop_codon:yes gene_type:complete